MEAMGISVMLAGNMGEGAKNKLESHNIKVVRGCRGNIEMVVRAYLIGLIKDSGEGCSHHECGSHK
jgi:predicted Fe-Mo cluster-binding NifX family protein